MAWDPNRKVPWKRLLRPFLLYVVVALVAFAIFARDSLGVGTVIGLFFGGLLYAGVAAVMVKLGWDPTQVRARKNAAQSRSAAETRSTSTRAKGSPPAPTKAKPAPTSRTNASSRSTKAKATRR